MLSQILKYCNRTQVADELKRRGVEKVSGESLNRWVREGTELRPEVERELRKLFGLPTNKEAAPDMPGRLDKIERYLKVIARGVPVPADVLADIETAHHDVSGRKPEPPLRGAARRKADRRPPGR